MMSQDEISWVRAGSPGGKGVKHRRAVKIHTTLLQRRPVALDVCDLLQSVSQPVSYKIVSPPSCQPIQVFLPKDLESACSTSFM